MGTVLMRAVVMRRVVVISVVGMLFHLVVTVIVSGVIVGFVISVVMSLMLVMVMKRASFCHVVLMSTCFRRFFGRSFLAHNPP